MPYVTVGDAQARLPELMDSLPPGEVVCLTRDGVTVAKLVKMDLAKAATGLWEWSLISITDDDQANVRSRPTEPDAPARAGRSETHRHGELTDGPFSPPTLAGASG